MSKKIRLPFTGTEMNQEDVEIVLTKASKAAQVASARGNQNGYEILHGVIDANLDRWKEISGDEEE